MLGARGEGPAGLDMLVPLLAAVAGIRETAGVADARKLINDLAG